MKAKLMGSAVLFNQPLHIPLWFNKKELSMDDNSPNKVFKIEILERDVPRRLE